MSFGEEGETRGGLAGRTKEAAGFGPARLPMPKMPQRTRRTMAARASASCMLEARKMIMQITERRVERIMVAFVVVNAASS